MTRTTRFFVALAALAMGTIAYAAGLADPYLALVGMAPHDALSGLLLANAAGGLELKALVEAIQTGFENFKKLNDSLGHQTGDEQAHGFDGANYFSDGNDTTTVDFTTIVPKLGHADTTMRSVMINKTPIMLTLTLEGGIEQVKGRFTARDYDSDSKSGMVKCSWKFMGGKPEIIG